MQTVELDRDALDAVYLGDFSGLLLHAELWQDEDDGRSRERAALYDGAEGISLLLTDQQGEYCAGLRGMPSAGRKLTPRLHVLRTMLNSVIGSIVAEGSC